MRVDASYISPSLRHQRAVSFRPSIESPLASIGASWQTPPDEIEQDMTTRTQTTSHNDWELQ